MSDDWLWKRINC